MKIKIKFDCGCEREVTLKYSLIIKDGVVSTGDAYIEQAECNACAYAIGFDKGCQHENSDKD